MLWRDVHLRATGLAIGAAVQRRKILRRDSGTVLESNRHTVRRGRRSGIRRSPGSGRILVQDTSRKEHLISATEPRREAEEAKDAQQVDRPLPSDVSCIQSRWVLFVAIPLHGVV